MLKCSQEAFTKCPTAQYCGSRDDAVYMEGSACDSFNRNIEKEDCLKVVTAMVTLGEISEAAGLSLAAVDEILKGNHV